jgi:hypothetical protein
MSDLNRRQFLKRALANLVQAAGSVTLASAAVARAQSNEPQSSDDHGPAAGDLQQRADELAASFRPGPHGAPGEEEPGESAEVEPGEQAQVEPVQIRRRRPLRRGPWPNGVWRNGGWRNGPFLNGGWPNGFWRNVPWRNGGWPNGGWRNW